ncbi:acyltransferase family protein [Rubellimicrobium thermophilum]|nr:acyltransferase family protein [Rubellimicrobium thermophilum]
MTPSLPPAPAATRRQSIDLLRFVAAFGVVWAHMQAPGMVEGYVALALFTILTAFLSLRSLARRGPRWFWLGRLVRFGLPWVVWSAFYLLLELWRAEDPRMALTLTDPLRLLIGPTVHLWFLPFIILSSPLVLLALHAMTSARHVWILSLLLIPAAMGALWAHDRIAPPEPVIQWAFAALPFLYGLLSAGGQRHDAVAAPLLFATASCVGASLLWGSIPAPFLLLACLLFEGLWRLPLSHPALPALGQLAYGIYLVHPFFMLVWYRFAGGWSAIAGAFAVFVASASAAWLIRRLPGGRLIA